MRRWSGDTPLGVPKSGTIGGYLLSPLWALRTVRGQCWQGVDGAGRSPDVGSSRLLMLR